MLKNSRIQAIALFTAVVGIIALAVFTTLYLSGGVVGIGFGDGDNKGYKNVTLTDAQVECENYAREELGRRLKTLSVDNHSTRYDEIDNRYKIFMQAELYNDNNRKGVTETFHIYCFTRGDRAAVAQFRLIEDKDYKPSVIRKEEGGIFGWQ